MNITFVFPPIPYKYAKTPYPPLGIAYLAAIIRQRCNYISDISYINGQILNDEAFWRNVSQASQDVVIISSSIRQINDSKIIARIVRNNNPKAFIILGGPGPSSVVLSCHEYFNDSDINIVIKGEAENSLVMILDRIHEGRSLSDIPNIVLNSKGKVSINNFTPLFTNVSDIPWPDRSIFDNSVYLDRWKRSIGSTSVHMIGSRGCPYSCIFCDKTVTGSRIRCRNIDDIVNEMVFLQDKYSPDDIFYFDDLFTVNKKRTIKLCKGVMNAKSFNTNWSVQGRVDKVDEEMLEQMVLAGCSEIMFGVESGSDRILKYLKKGFVRKDIINAFEMCHKVGIKPGAYVIIGVPGETLDDTQDTISLVEQIEPSLLNFSFLTPYPNTTLYEETKDLISNWNYKEWDDFDATIYKHGPNVDPFESRDKIFNAYLKKIQKVCRIADTS